MLAPEAFMPTCFVAGGQPAEGREVAASWISFWKTLLGNPAAVAGVSFWGCGRRDYCRVEVGTTTVYLETRELQLASPSGAVEIATIVGWKSGLLLFTLKPGSCSWCLLLELCKSGLGLAYCMLLRCRGSSCCCSSAR